jgi:hypothetical protein
LEHTSELLDRLSAGLIDHNAKPEETCLLCGIYFREKCLVRELVGRRCFYANHRARRGPKAESNAEEGAEASQ